jgi:hypothetical protein
MPFMPTNSAGIAMVTIHAPCVNFVMSTITRTTPVNTAPVALSTCERRIDARRPAAAVCSSVRQCRTMPHWLSVNETKTPMM